MGKPGLRIALFVMLVALTAAYVRGAGAQAAAGLSGVASVPAASLQGSPTVVTLITGDRVALSYTGDGRPVVAFNPAGGPQAGGGFQTLTAGPHVYVIPLDAAGYLGAPLDLSLFDVTALAAAGYGSSSIPLALDITASSGSVASSALPGIAITDHGKGAQSRTDAARFGRALSAEKRARKQGNPGSGLFAGIDRIAVAGSAPAATSGVMVPAGQPAGKLYTLTVKGFDQNGQKVWGNFGVVYNVDDGNTFLAAQSFFNGTFSYSVPAGNYQITALIGTATSANETSFAFVTAPEVTVKSSTVVVLEARKTSRVGVTVPDPTSAVIGEMTLQRDPAQGPNFTDSFTTFGPTPLYVSPTRPVTVGQQYFYPYFRLGDAAGGLDRYVYDLQFEYIGGIPDDLQPTLGRADLATVAATYHSSSPGRGELDGRISLAPWQSSVGITLTRLAAPLTRTEYVLPQPDARWLQILVTDEQEFAGFATDNWRAVAPGDHTLADWTAQPEPPGIEQQGADVAQPCPVCRSGDTLSTTLFPYVDPAGNRTVPDSGVVAELSLYLDGMLIDRQPSGAAQFVLIPAPATYQLVMDVSRDAAWWPTSTRSHTVWTFASSERAPDTLPAGWTCGGKGGGGGGGGKGATTTAGKGGGGGGGGGTGDGCSFEPFLFASYDTHAGPDDIVPAGHDATVEVTIRRQDYAPRAAIANLTFDVSFDDGASWTPAAVAALGDGRFQATYPQPALDATTGFASFRIAATDEEGSKLEQQITRAYPLSVTPPAGGGDGPGNAPAPFRACTTPVIAPYVQCMAIVAPASGLGTAAPARGYGPAEIASAYRLPAGAGAGRTVAIVDAYDDPNAEADLAAYREAFGLPPCTTANGCFRKVNQHGAEGPLPTPDPGWGLEISLDLDAVSATCPSCKILLVEAYSPSLLDLGPAVDTAVAFGADAVSNSYGSRGEFSGEQYFERYYKHTGVAITVSSGDYGYGNGLILTGGVSYPGASQFVTSVGGTALVRDGSERGWTETAWAGSTSGCSATSGASQTSQRLPIRTPGWPCTTPSASADGSSSAGRASARRSSPASTRWLETPPACGTAWIRTGPILLSSTSWMAATAPAVASTSAPDYPATTAPPGSERPTDSAASDVGPERRTAPLIMTGPRFRRSRLRGRGRRVESSPPGAWPPRAELHRRRSAGTHRRWRAHPAKTAPGARARCRSAARDRPSSTGRADAA